MKKEPLTQKVTENESEGRRKENDCTHGVIREQIRYDSRG